MSFNPNLSCPGPWEWRPRSLWLLLVAPCRVASKKKKRLQWKKSTTAGAKTQGALSPVTETGPLPTALGDPGPQHAKTHAAG